MSNPNTDTPQDDDLFNLDALDAMEIPDAEITYQPQDDSGCEGGACKI